MTAGQIVSVDRRLRVPVAALVLATTFLIGAVAGATIPSLVSRTEHPASGSVPHAAIAATRGDMSSAAYAALRQATAATTATGGDMSSAAYAALRQATAATTATGGDMSSAAYAALRQAGSAIAATRGDMSAAAYAALHPAAGASSSTRGDMSSAANLNHRGR